MIKPIVQLNMEEIQERLATIVAEYHGVSRHRVTVDYRLDFNVKDNLGLLRIIEDEFDLPPTPQLRVDELLI